MSNKFKPLREFGRFRLDAEKKFLWYDDQPVQIPLKALELLCVLVENPGAVVTKDEIWRGVWKDSFVEETNLTHNIYLLRKTFKSLGAPDLIQTVPRRGYRFDGEVREYDDDAGDFVIERHTLTQTLIEEISPVEVEEPEAAPEKKLIEKPDFDIEAKKERRSFYPSFLNAKAVALLLVVLVTAAGGFAVWRHQTSQTKTSVSEIRSIAVLPIRSFSTDAENASLRMRITDALITKLGGFNEIAVRPTNSVYHFETEEYDAVEAGKVLGVDAVFDGRVQVEKERLRVTLQLISIKNGEQLWSEKFDGRTDQILALQDAITDRLREKFAFIADEHRNPTENNEAYEAYLKGRHLWNQRTAESYWKALSFFRQSIEADPNFALGYTGISDCYHLLQQRNVLSPDEAFSNAETAARKALELDPNLAQAHTSMAAVSFLYYARLAEAEKYYLRAIELNPNYAEAHAWYGMMLNAQGRFDEAFTELKKAEQLDPTSLNIAIYLGANFYFSKQYERAAQQFQQILDFAPNTERAHFFLTRIYELNGRYDEAVASALKERSVTSPQTVESLRLAYQKQGIRGFWQKQIELLKEESKIMHGLDPHIASRYILLGDAERAFYHIEKDFKSRGHMWDYAGVDPSFERIRGDARFQDVLRKIDAASFSAPNKF